MKIGILTHHYINNYGAFLQTYALQEALSRQFQNDEIVVINYMNIKHFIINTGGWFRFYKSKENLKSWMQKAKVPNTFFKARKKWLKQTKLCYTTKQVNALKLDVIVVGSDEVWNYKESKGNAKIKFGHGLTCQNLITYAPSVGKTTIVDGVPEYVKAGIEKFSHLSVRDNLSAELIRNVSNKKITRVLDPTFLYDFPRTSLPISNSKYILFYYCDKLPEKIKAQIFEDAKMNGFKIYGAGECDKSYSDITVNLTPFEWVEMFKNASFVFTGTFHGAVFSILNKKQFKVFLTNESRIKKVNDLLSELHINNRNIDDDFIFNYKLMESEINYDATYKEIEIQKKNSINYLINAIK